MPKLGVNIDHVATVREARKTFEPDPVWAAAICETAGCHSIVVHLRQDRRHINDRDVQILAEKTERQQAVWNTIRDLNHEFREILVMKHIEGRSYNEIASIIGIPKGTVMSRLYHARCAFRDKFEKRVDHEEL